MNAANDSLTELPQGRTHVQFFLGGICIASVRVEYAHAFRDAVATSAKGDALNLNNDQHS